MRTQRRDGWNAGAGGAAVGARVSEARQSGHRQLAGAESCGRGRLAGAGGDTGD